MFTNPDNKLCNKCVGEMNNLVMFHKDLPNRRQAKALCLQEFQENHDDDECLNELICLPVKHLKEHE